MNIERRYQLLKNNITPIILLATYIVLHTPIESFLNISLIKPLLEKVESSYINDLIFGLSFVVMISYSFWNYKSNVYVSDKLAGWSVFFVILLIWYRLPVQQQFEYCPFIIFPEMKYVDTLSAYFLNNIILKLLYEVKELKVTKNAGFVFDNPIENEAGDLIGRKKFAKKLAHRISNTSNNKSAFAVGIASEWGNGKTSFLKLIHDNLSTDNRIIIHFNPWLNNDEKSVIKSFFDQLSKALRIYNRELSTEIIKYANLLSNIDDSIISKVTNIFSSILNGNETLEARFDKINNAIKLSGKQIVIFIDDLDRLYETEVIEILKLVRNSASFSNTVFIVAYDRNFVVNSIKKANGYKPHKFLEKIFQLEFTLPAYEHHVIENYLKEQIAPYLTKEDMKDFEKLFEKKITLYYIDAFRYDLLKSMRDVNRFVNSFITSYEFLKGEIFLPDLLNLEILRIKYLSVYDFLSNKYDTYLTTIEGLTNEYEKTNYFVLAEINKENDPKKEKSILTNYKDSNNTFEDVYFNLNSNKSLIEQYLFEHYFRLGLSKSDLVDVLEHVYAVFPHTFTTSAVKFSNLSIRHPASIDRYFHNSLLISNISEIDFSKFRLKSFEEFSSQIKLWVDKGLRLDVSRKLEQINHFANRTDFENVVRVIFYFATLLKLDDKRIIGFNQQNLKRKIQTPQNQLLFSSKEEYVDFIIDVFKSQKSPFDFSRSFIESIFKDTDSIDNWAFVIPKQDLIDLSLWHFNTHAQQTERLDKHFFYLFHGCRYKEWRKKESSNGYEQIEIYPEEAKDSFIKSATDKIEYFIKNIIAKAYNTSNPDDDYHYYSILFETVLLVWSDWNYFEDFINGFNENEVHGLREFKKFYEKCKANEFRYIEYHFIDIDLSDAVKFTN